jgi:hypothetical protein
MSNDDGYNHHPLTPSFTTSQENEGTGGYETIVGFVGDSPREGHVRVYAGLAFLNYFEVASSDIARATPLDASDAEGPTVVRVRAGAHVAYVRMERLEGEAGYVLGAVRASYRGPTDDSARESYLGEKMMPLDPVSVVYPPCPPPITPVLYCLSDVYPPC